MQAAIMLDAKQVSAKIPEIDVLGEMRQLFKSLGNGQAVQPSQTLTEFSDGSGDFITYLGAWNDAGIFGSKLSPYIVGDERPTITAWTLLMSAKTGQPLMLCDSGQLTTERTAATTALAVDLLAKKEARKIAIIGSGAVAQAHWRYVEGLRDWGLVKIFSPNLADNEDLKSKWRSICGNIEFADTAKEAVTDCDVVMLCTSSGTPVVDVADTIDGALITSISTNVAKAHEIEPAYLNQMRVYCDYKKTTPQSAGEMVLASENHGWSEGQIMGDLGDLANGRCEVKSSNKRSFFRSIGLGLEDIAVANALYKMMDK